MISPGVRLGILLGGALLATAILTPARPQNSGRERDAWQRPTQVMDELGIHAGSAVADVGCGEGYFTFRLAWRVGAAGRVYAEDVDAEALSDVKNRAERQDLLQVETVQGTADNPMLPPAALDVVLIVNAYHEFRQHDAMLKAFYRALKPGGRLAIIDGVAQPGRSRSEYASEHHIPEAMVRQDAIQHGFTFVRQPSGFIRPDDGKKFYFLIFAKPTGVLQEERGTR